MKKNFTNQSNFIYYCLIFFITLVINFSCLYFEYVYRNQTIYFPVSYGFSTLKDNPFSQAEYLWGWSNGRWFGALLESYIFFPLINSLFDLKISTFIGIFFTSICSIIFFKFLLKSELNKIENLSISIGIFTLPGFLYFNFMGAINSQLTLILTMISGYILFDKNIFTKKINLATAIGLFFLAASNYTPAIFLIAIYPVSYFFFFNNNSQETKKQFFKYLFFIILNLFLFYIFKTFLISVLYDLLHFKFLNIYSFFKNEHQQYSTELIINLYAIKNTFYKIYLIFTQWIINDLNIWNIYPNFLTTFLSIIFFLFFQKKLLNNYKKKYFYYSLILYLLPIIIWLPFKTNLITYRGSIGTASIVVILFFYIIFDLNKKVFLSSKIFLIFILTVIILNSSFNQYQNTKNASLEFVYIKESLQKIESGKNHIHIILPEVGYSYTGLTSINEEFNRPSVLSWQEMSRYINSAFVGINGSWSDVKIIVDDCKTTVGKLNDKKFIYYNIEFPSKWDIPQCLKKLKANSILITWSYPYSLDQKKLRFRQRYTDLSEGMLINNINISSNTLIIDMNDLNKK